MKSLFTRKRIPKYKNKLIIIINFYGTKYELRSTPYSYRDDFR